jgi:flagellar M-ring protein FliF
MAMVNDMWSTWSAGKRWAFVLGAVSIVLIACAVGWWTSRTTYAVLFSNLKDVDAAEIATTLDGWQTPHRFADGGATILVPTDAVYDTRMKLVSQGVPHGGNVGFEAFKDSDFGVTEFAQRVNYQRALQGELERTITSIAGIQSARVHLTLRKATMFESVDAPAKASVALTLASGAQLAPRQVTGIQRLIASAVDGLNAESVVVLGRGGATLSASGGADEQGDEQTRVETRLRQRVEGLLLAALGGERHYTVSVDAQLNYNHVKQVRESLLAQGKDGNGLLVRQKTSNTHPVANVDGDAPKVAASGESELEFAHGREQEEVDVAPGRIERLSLGVVLPQDVPVADVAKLRDVIAAAVGLDTHRGDRLDIASLASVAPRPATAIDMPAMPKSSPVRQAPAPHWTIDWIATTLYALLAVACFTGGILLSRRRQPKRLSLEQRDNLLRDVRQWIDAPERVV